MQCIEHNSPAIPQRWTTWPFICLFMYCLSDSVLPWPKATRGGQDSFHLHTSTPSIVKGSPGKNSRLESGVGDWIRNHGSVILIGLLPMAGAACFPIHTPWKTCPGQIMGVFGARRSTESLVVNVSLFGGLDVGIHKEIHTMDVWLVKFLRQVKILSETLVWYFQLRLWLAGLKNELSLRRGHHRWDKTIVNVSSGTGNRNSCPKAACTLCWQPHLGTCEFLRCFRFW